MHSRGPLELQADALEYHAYAVNLLEQGTYANNMGERATRTPGYPLFLAAIYKIFGPSVRAVQAAQALLGAGVCVFILFITARWLPPGWALASGMLAAFYYDLYSIVPLILSEGLDIFLLSIFFCAWLQRGKKIWFSGAAGLVLGLACLVRSEILPIAPLLTGFISISGPENGDSPGLAPAEWFKKARWRWERSLAFLAMFLLVLSPWVLRNKKVLGAWVPTSTRAGWQFYSGLSDSRYRRFEPPRQLRVEGLGELELDKTYMQAGVEVYQKVPVKLLFKSWTYNIAVLFYPFLPEYDFSMVFLMPFLAWGAWAWRKNPETWIFTAFLLYLVALFSVMGAANARYRQLFAPALIPLACLGLYDLARRWRPTPFKAAVGGWATANGLVFMFSNELRQGILFLKDRIYGY